MEIKNNNHPTKNPLENVKELVKKMNDFEFQPNTEMNYRTYCAYKQELKDSIAYYQNVVTKEEHELMKAATKELITLNWKSW